MRYLSGREVSYTHDDLGRPLTVNGALGAETKAYVQGVQYTAFGAVSEMRLNGTNLRERFQYSPERLQLTGLDVEKCANENCTSPEEMLHLEYVYGPMNNGNGAVVSRPGLSSMTPQVTSCTEANVLTLFPGNRIAGSNYDAGGELANDGRSDLRFDIEDRLRKTIPVSGSETNYLYDGEGKRVMKQTGTAKTVFVYDAMGQLAAEYGGVVTTGTQYLHGDMLGSTRLVTNGTAVSRRFDYFPFGGELTNGETSYRGSGAGFVVAGDPAQRFTGKERDGKTGLDYFGARYLSGAQGRFTGADGPLVDQFVQDPQSWNLYSYTANNPLSRIDPTGQNWFSVNGTWEWHEGDEYTYKDKNGKRHTLHSNYTHLLVFQQTGTNKYGAATGTLTLYDQNRAVATSSDFSGGAPGKGPVPEGTFMIRPGIRDTADASDIRQTPEGPQIKQFYGIQQIPEDVGGYDVRYEWGSIRAALNEPTGERRPNFLGNYLHGKTRAGDYTHGCICERSERILNMLHRLDYRKTPAVPVWVRRR